MRPEPTHRITLISQLIPKIGIKDSLISKMRCGAEKAYRFRPRTRPAASDVARSMCGIDNVAVMLVYIGDTSREDGI